MAMQSGGAPRYASSRNRKKNKSKGRGWKIALLLGLLVGLMALGAGVTGRKPWGMLAELMQGVRPGDRPGDADGETSADELAVHFIDVGQADCALLTAQGKHILIDTGNRDDFTVIDAYLRAQGVVRLEAVWLTHPHEDHIGGATQILKRYEVGAVYMGPVTEEMPLYIELQERLQKEKVRQITPQAGEEIGFGDCRIQVLGPVSVSARANNNSLILKVIYGNTSFLFTGDAERDEEIAVLESGADVQADVLKVGHHGSETSTSYYFLRQVWPQYAVVSVGAANEYGHPHEAVLSRLEDAEVTVYRTDERGTVLAVSDGHNVIFADIE